MTLLKVLRIIWAVSILIWLALGADLVAHGRVVSVVKLQILPLCCVWLSFAVIRLFTTVEPKGRQWGTDPVPARSRSL